jgi:hypothetical protein
MRRSLTRHVAPPALTPASLAEADSTAPGFGEGSHDVNHGSWHSYGEDLHDVNHATSHSYGTRMPGVTTVYGEYEPFLRHSPAPRRQVLRTSTTAPGTCKFSEHQPPHLALVRFGHPGEWRRVKAGASNIPRWNRTVPFDLRIVFEEFGPRRNSPIGMQEESP